LWIIESQWKVTDVNLYTHRVAIINLKILICFIDNIPRWNRCVILMHIIIFFQLHILFFLRKNVWTGKTISRTHLQPAHDLAKTILILRIGEEKWLPTVIVEIRNLFYCHRSEEFDSAPMILAQVQPSGRRRCI